MVNKEVENVATQKVTLWTRQDIKSLEALEKNGYIRITREHLAEKFEEITDYIVPLYQWFTVEAEKRVPRPAGVAFPVWCAISEENMLRPVPGQVVYQLEVDPAEIVYFDGQKWDYVLNHHYVAKDEADRKAYQQDLVEKGFDNAFSFIEGKTAHLYPEERQRVMNSWVRVFDIDDWNIFNVQANIWEIRKDMITQIIYSNEETESIQ